MAVTMAQTLMPGRMAMARLIFRVMVLTTTQFEKHKLQIEEESEHEEGSIACDSLDEIQSGVDQDVADPDEAVHERFRQDFLMQASAEELQTPIGKAWNSSCRRGRRSSDFCVFVGFFDSSFYFC
jgi:hypothetical protein